MSNEAASGLVGESGNTQPRPGMESAVEAAAKALADRYGETPIDDDRANGRAALAAAYPVIADAVLAEAERRIGELDPIDAALAGQHAFSDAAAVVADLRRGLGENQ